jgi:hypothetical protein
VAHFYYPSKLGNLRKTTTSINDGAGAKDQTPCRLNSVLFARDQDGAGHWVNCASILGNGRGMKPSQAKQTVWELNYQHRTLKKIPSHLFYLYEYTEKYTERLQISE